VAIVYGIDPGLPERIRTWRDRGYRIHVMTGVSWGNYQDYLYGRFDGVNHEDEAQTDATGRKISHGGDVYYMCPGENFGKFLCVGVQRALDAGAEAIHLEEPEFWVRGGYSEGFQREWRKHYGETGSRRTNRRCPMAASKLKYFLYRRALQQVFDHIQDWNRRTGKKVRCYVPTHSLLNYAHWRIVSPESSLARLQGCDGYIAQVWTGHVPDSEPLPRSAARSAPSRPPFSSTAPCRTWSAPPGAAVWYLNDPIEDNPTTTGKTTAPTGNPRWSPRCCNPRSGSTRSPRGPSGSSADAIRRSCAGTNASRFRPPTRPSCRRCSTP
jgi:hypothetical protein